MLFCYWIFVKKCAAINHRTINSTWYQVLVTIARTYRQLVLYRHHILVYRYMIALHVSFLPFFSI